MVATWSSRPLLSASTGVSGQDRPIRNIQHLHTAYRQVTGTMTATQSPTASILNNSGFRDPRANRLCITNHLRHPYTRRAYIRRGLPAIRPCTRKDLHLPCTRRTLIFADETSVLTRVSLLLSLRRQSLSANSLCFLCACRLFPFLPQTWKP